MGAGEEGMHERLQALLDLVDPKIREHHGRIVKNTADGVLAEFAGWSTRCAALARSSAGG
jgi:adenylate cyclase